MNSFFLKHPVQIRLRCTNDTHIFSRAVRRVKRWNYIKGQGTLGERDLSILRFEVTHWPALFSVAMLHVPQGNKITRKVASIGAGRKRGKTSALANDASIRVNWKSNPPETLVRGMQNRVRGLPARIPLDPFTKIASDPANPWIENFKLPGKRFPQTFFGEVKLARRE